MYTSAIEGGGEFFGRRGLWLGRYGSCLVLVEEAKAVRTAKDLLRGNDPTRLSPVWFARAEGNGCDQELDQMFDTLDELVGELDRLGVVEFDIWDADLAKQFRATYSSKKLERAILERCD